MNVTELIESCINQSKLALPISKSNECLSNYENIDFEFNSVMEMVKQEYEDSSISEVTITPQLDSYFFEIHLIEENIEYEVSVGPDSKEVILEEKDIEDDENLYLNRNFLPNEMMSYHKF